MILHTEKCVFGTFIVIFAGAKNDAFICLCEKEDLQFYQTVLGHFCSKRCVSEKVGDIAGYANVDPLSARWQICLLLVLIACYVTKQSISYHVKCVKVPSLP
jgi:hypothetical protein